MSSPCLNYRGGTCGCQTCIFAEHSAGIDRNNFKIIESRDYIINDRWAVNDHRAGEVTISSTKTQGVTKGYTLGLEHNLMGLFFRGGETYQWTESTSNTVSYTVTRQYKGRVNYKYKFQKIEVKYLKFSQSWIVIPEERITFDHWDPDTKIVEIEYLYAIEVELIPLIKSHIFLNIRTLIDRSYRTFKYCTIQAYHSRKYIDVDSSKNEIGTQLIQYDKNDEQKTNNQQFTFVVLPNESYKGYFLSECCKNEKSIGVVGEIAEGSPIQIQQINPQSRRQIFNLEIFHRDGDNYWCFIVCSSNPNLVWEIERGSKSNCRRLVLGRRKGAEEDKNHQLFCLNNS